MYDDTQFLKTLFLTYDGLMRVINVARTGTARRFRKWTLQLENAPPIPEEEKVEDAPPIHKKKIMPKKKVGNAPPIPERKR